MLSSYLRIALRNLAKHPKYTLINLAALTLGLAPVIVILLYLQYEFGFDRHNLNARSIYRLVYQADGLFGQSYSSPIYPAPTASLIKNKLPGVVAATTIAKKFATVSYAKRVFSSKNFFSVDPAIFEVLTLPLEQGDPKSVLNDPNSIVLTQESSVMLFGSEDPIGRTVIIDDSREATVTGVLKDLPVQSHFLPDFLVPTSKSGFSTMAAGHLGLNSWGFATCFIYFLVDENVDVDQMQHNFIRLLRSTSTNDALNSYRHSFQPLTDIHLRSHLQTELGPNGDLDTVMLFAAIALATLLIACITYINLATVRSTERAKEIGLRKICGANRTQVVLQFLGESCILTLAATCAAILLIELTLPFVSSYLQRDLSSSAYLTGSGLTWLLAIIILVSVCSGSYPALVLSRFAPVDAVKGTKGGRGLSHFRRALVIIQFACSVTFILLVTIVREQLQYCRDLDPGYHSDPVLVIPIDRDMRPRLDVLKEELGRTQGVSAVSSMLYLLDQGYNQRRIELQTSQGRSSVDFCYSNVDYDYLDFFGIGVIEGRKFSRNSPGDIKNAFILNESAVRALGWTGSPIGRTFSDQPNHKGTVIGVIRDYHLESLHQPIRPLYLQIDPDGFYLNLCIRISARDRERTIASIHQVFQRVIPNVPFNYRFYDDLVDAQYQTERRFQELTGFFAILAILIAGFGLVGLVSMTVAQRTKEIGIRKVLGASRLGISTLLSSDYLRLGLIASLLAWPIAYWAASLWLADFTYRVPIRPATLLISSLAQVALVIVLVGFQSFRATSRNPVEALRYE